MAGRIVPCLGLVAVFSDSGSSLSGLVPLRWARSVPAESSGSSRDGASVWRSPIVLLFTGLWRSVAETAPRLEVGSDSLGLLTRPLSAL